MKVHFDLCVTGDVYWFPTPNNALTKVKWRSQGYHIYRKEFQFLDQCTPLYYCVACRDEASAGISSLFNGYIYANEMTLDTFIREHCYGEELCYHAK
jgi:hypothetical protein